MRTIIRTLQDINIPALKVGMRQEVTAYEPGDDAGVTTQPAHLIAKRTADEGDILRANDATIFLVDGLAQILSPLPLTTPAREHEQTVAVTEVIDILRGTPDILEADAVEVHVTHIAHLQFVGLWRVAQKDIIRPSCTTDEHRFAVEHKPTETLRGVIVLHLTDAKGELFIIGHLIINNKLQCHVVEFGLTHVMAPPQTGMLHVEGLETANAEVAHLFRGEGDWRRELTAIKLSTHLTIDGLVREVAERSTHSEPRLIEGLEINLRLHAAFADGDITRTDDAYLTEDTHRLVEGTRVPIHETDVRITRLGTEHLHLQFILGLGDSGDVKHMPTERAAECILRGYLCAIDKDIGAIADAIEDQQHMFGTTEILQREVSTVPP